LFPGQMGRPQLSTQRRPRSPEALPGTAVLAAISDTAYQD